MVRLYSGTPGSGKSLHAAYDIWKDIKIYKRMVIVNFEIDLTPMVDKRHSLEYLQQFLFYVPDEELTVHYLRRHAYDHHKEKGEKQTRVYIDECATKFNPRSFQAGDRNKWITLFLQHRKLGFDVVLITQGDRLIDRQIRLCIEIEVKHRSMRNYKTFGWILSLITGGMFHYVETWYCARLKLGNGIFLLNKKKASIYDTFTLFTDNEIFRKEDEEKKRLSECLTVEVSTESTGASLAATPVDADNLLYFSEYE